MIAGPLRYPVDRARVRVVHPRIDLEPVTLASAIFPGGRAQIAQRYLALAAVELRDLPEFRGVAFAGAAGETIEDASADAVDRVGATRLHQPKLVKRLMREKRAACRGFRPTGQCRVLGKSNGDETWRVRSSRSLRHRAWSCMSPQARWRITSVSCAPATCCSYPVRFASTPKAS